jgi:hypothetical protein
MPFENDGDNNKLSTGQFPHYLVAFLRQIKESVADMSNSIIRN